MTDNPLTKLEQRQKEFDELWRSAEFPVHGRPSDCADRCVADHKGDGAADAAAPRLLGLFPRHISETDPSSCAQVGVELTKSNFIPPSGGKGEDGSGQLARLQELDARCALHVIARGYTVFRASTPTTQLSMDKYNYRTEDLKFKTGGAVAPSMGLRNVGLAIPTDIYQSTRAPFEPQWTQHGVEARTPATPDNDDDGVGQEIAETFRAFGINHGCPYFHIYSTAGGKFGLVPHRLLYDLITRQLQARIKSPRDLPVSNVVQRDGAWFPFIPMRELMKRRARRTAYNEKRRATKDNTEAAAPGATRRLSLGEKQPAAPQNTKDAPSPAKIPSPSTPRNNSAIKRKMGRMPGKVISSPVNKWVYTEELGPRTVYRIGQLTPTQGEAGDYMFLGGSTVEKQNFAAGPLRDDINPGEEEYYAIRLYKRHIDQASELVTWTEAYPGSYAKCLNSIEEARDYLARVPSVPAPKKRPAPKKKTSTKKRAPKGAASKKSAAPKKTPAQLAAVVQPRYKVGDALNVGDPALELDPMEVVAMEHLLFRGAKRLAAVVQVNDEDGLTEYAVLDPSDADYNDENTGGAVITLQRHPDPAKFTLDHQEYVAMWPEEENLPVCQGRSAAPKRARKKAQSPIDVYRALGQATTERNAASGGVDEGEEATSNGSASKSKRSSSGGGGGGGGGGGRTRNPPPERKAADVQKYIVSTTGMTLTSAKKLNTAITTLFEQVGATLNKQPATNVDPLTALAMGNRGYADFDYLCDEEASPSEMLQRLSNIQQLRDVMCNMFPVLSRAAGNYFKTAVESVVGTDQWSSLKPADISQALADHPDFRIAAASILAQGGDLFYKKFGSVSNEVSDEPEAAPAVGKKRARPKASQGNKEAPAKKKQKVNVEEEPPTNAVEEQTSAETMQFDDDDDEAMAALQEYEAERDQAAQNATPMIEDEGQEEAEEEEEEEEQDAPDSQRSAYSLENEAMEPGEEQGDEEVEDDDVIESD